jgi:hypothetical protein
VILNPLSPKLFLNFLNHEEKAVPEHVSYYVIFEVDYGINLLWDIRSGNLIKTAAYLHSATSQDTVNFRLPSSLSGDPKPQNCYSYL